MIRVLFVCTGNICRSPTAEAVFRHLAAKAGLEAHVSADSAGTDAYHSGQGPDRRAVRVAQRNGVSLEGLQARQLAPADYEDFDYIFAMDGGHLYEIESRAPQAHKARVAMFLHSASHLLETDVPDPWYGTEKDFENVYHLIAQGCEAILAKLKEEHRL